MSRATLSKFYVGLMIYLWATGATLKCLRFSIETSLGCYVGCQRLLYHPDIIHVHHQRSETH